MTKDLPFTRLSQVARAVASGDPALGAGGTLVIPEPMWAEASSESRAEFTALIEARGFRHRIERRWQRRPPEGPGITSVAVERDG